MFNRSRHVEAVAKHVERPTSNDDSILNVQVALEWI